MTISCMLHRMADLGGSLLLRKAGLGLVGICAVAACAAHQSTPSATDGVSASAEQFQLGQALTSENCVTCHAVSSGSASPNPGAPALSEVAATYSSDVLFDDFRTGNHVGGEEMPIFDFTIQETDAIIAYLDKIYADTLDCGNC